jgi:RepB DNA-primase N-terminal domain
MSSVVFQRMIWIQSAQLQLQAMKVPLFEVGAYKARSTIESSEPEMFLRTWDGQTILGSLDWLRLQNLRGRNIFVRPKGEHPLSLIDDLTDTAIARMKVDGFTPAVIVETSPGNFQAWLNHGEILTKELSTAAARALAEKFGGDKGAADWRHFGRLAGFTNRKEKYRNLEGAYPIVKLVEVNGQIYEQAQRFLASLEVAFNKQQVGALMQRQHFQFPRGTRRDQETIVDFRCKPIYQGDGHRIDLAYAVYALSHHVPESEVRAAIASRDLSHKGNAKRQADYVNRTIEKAWKAVRGQTRER